MRERLLPGIGMRTVKTAIGVMLAYTLFALLQLLYRTEYGGIWGQLGPNYACVACIVCTQSTLGQSVRQGFSRLVGVAVGGTLGVLALMLGSALEQLPVRVLALGVACVAGVWICLLLRQSTACGLACILPCAIIITGTGAEQHYYYAAARIIETVVGVLIALLVNAVLPDRREEERQTPPAAEMTVRLTNTTQKLCVIGDPVEHSKSPLLQNRMIAALGLDYIYLCQKVPGDQTARWLECARLAGYAGFNATMPHKETLVPLMDELDGDAALIGAVNTVCIRNGKCYGYNTDGEGFLRSLTAAGLEVKGLRVVLLGAGGAARAVALKLSSAGAERVTVCNRTRERAEELCRQDPLGRLQAAGFERDVLCREASECDLLVNCTSLGMAGTEGQFEDFSFVDALPAGATVCDLIYAPAETELLRRAAARGHKTLNGAGMLFYQAVLALEHFTGAEIDAEQIRKQVLPLLHEKTEIIAKSP